MNLLSIGIFSSLICVTDGSAASFDCDAARFPDEVAVCSSNRLSNLDEVTAEKYRKARSLIGGANRSALQDGQREFLKARRDCGSDTSCIESLYKARIEVISGFDGFPMRKEKDAGQSGSTESSKCIVRLLGPAPNCPAVTYEPSECSSDTWGKAGDEITNPASIMIMKNGYAFYCPSHESCVSIQILEFSEGCSFR